MRFFHLLPHARLSTAFFLPPHPSPGSCRPPCPSPLPPCLPPEKPRPLIHHSINSGSHHATRSGRPPSSRSSSPPAISTATSHCRAPSSLPRSQNPPLLPYMRRPQFHSRRHPVTSAARPPAPFPRGPAFPVGCNRRPRPPDRLPCRQTATTTDLSGLPPPLPPGTASLVADSHPASIPPTILAAEPTSPASSPPTAPFRPCTPAARSHVARPPPHPLPCCLPSPTSSLAATFALCGRCPAAFAACSHSLSRHLPQAFVLLLTLDTSSSLRPHSLLVGLYLCV